MFFGTLFVNVLRGPPGFAFLNSAKAAWLWVLVLALSVATYFDLTMLMSR
jgi:hypothetical protein